MNLNQIDSAKNDFKKTIEINPKNIKALKRLSMAHISLGELTESEIYLKRCIDIEPNIDQHKKELKEVEDLINKNKELQKEKVIENWNKCFDLSKILVQKCHLNNELKETFFESAVNSFNLEEALNFYSSSFGELEKKNENVKYNLSLLYFSQGKYDKSKQILINLLSSTENPKIIIKSKTLEKKLEEIETKKNAANDCFIKNNFAGAITIYTELLTMDSNNKIFNGLIYANRALCYYKIKDYFKSLSDCNSSIDLNKKYWKSYYRRAQINIALKKPKEAIDDLRKVLELDATNREAIILLDDIEREQKKSKRKDYYKILELDKTASQEDIRRNYKKLAAKWHPDKNNENEEQKEYAEKMFIEVNEAYGILTNPRKKQIYDAGGNIDDNSTENNENEGFDIFKNSYVKNKKKEDNKFQNKKRNREWNFK